MFFFSYGDSGAIISKYVGYHGLTFSEEGISIKVRSELLDIDSKYPTYVYDKINITNNPEEICNLLGFNYSKWMTISSIEKLFEWLISSHYYTIDAFRFIAMEKRKSLSSRHFYISFLDKIGISDFNNINNKVINKEITKNQISILERYNKLHEIDNIRNRILLERERKEKFNANIFIDIGIEKFALSKIMKEFKISILNSNHSFEDWLDKNTKEQIDNIIRDFINNTSLFE